MGGAAPNQPEGAGDPGQGLRFDEVGLGEAASTDPALKNLNELKKKGARRAEGGLKEKNQRMTTTVEIVDPPKGES